MNKLIIKLIKNLDITDLIDRKEGKHVCFSNGYRLSIVQGAGRNDSNTFEVAVISPANKIDYQAMGHCDTLGYQSPEEVFALALKVSALIDQEAKVIKLRKMQEQYFASQYGSSVH
jgi:hypothetical protein